MLQAVGLQRVGHNLVTEQQLIIPLVEVILSHYFVIKCVCSIYASDQHPFCVVNQTMFI